MVSVEMVRFSIDTERVFMDRDTVTNKYWVSLVKYFEDQRLVEFCF